MTAPRNTWRYTMTVEVTTPEGVRSGYAVRQVTYHSPGYGFLGESQPHWDLKGQAVVVDLPNGRSLYALLRSAGNLGVSYGARIADSALGEGGRVRGWQGRVELYPNPPKTRILSYVDPLPMLVTFGNPADSKSVQLVEAHDAAATLGPGYALKRIDIEIVDEGVTTGIEQRLPWLSRVVERRLDPAFVMSSHPNLAETLSHGDFLQGYR